MSLQAQVKANAKAIQEILDKALKISELPPLSSVATTLQLGDMTAFEIVSTGDTVFATLAEVIAGLNARDSVEEFISITAFPGTGIDNKIFIAQDSNLLYRWETDSYIQVGGGSTQLGIGHETTLYSGDAIWVGGLNYFVWADHYMMDGVEYFDYISDTVTLATAHPSLNRIDSLIVQDDGAGNHTIEIKIGTPATVPVKETLDSELELEISFALLLFGETTPENVNVWIVYAEGGEWTITGGHASIDEAYGADPITGAISIRSVNTPHNSELIFTTGSPIATTDDLILSFNINLDTQWEWRNNQRITLDVEVMESGIAYSGRLRLNSDFGFGFDGLLTGVTQRVTMRMDRFPDFYDNDTFDGLRFRWKRTDTTGETFRLDDIQINKGTTTGPGDSGGDMYLAYAQLNTGLKTFADGSIALSNVIGDFSVFFTHAATALRTITIQDKSGTLAYLSDLNTYIHDQSTPALQWNINHELNKYPSVMIVDTAGYEIVTQIRYIDANNIQINCNEVTAGKGYLN